MINRKRRLNRKREDFFRSKLVLNSLKSKIAFFVIVLMFGVVIVLAGMDVADYRGDLRDSGKFDGKDINGVGLSPSKTLENNKVASSSQVDEKGGGEYDGYLVEFKEEPLAIKNKGLEDSNVAGANKRSKLEEHKDKIEKQHKNFKEKIKQISPKTKIKREFYIVFNGLSIGHDITQKEINELKALPDVKKITPNYNVEFDLMDSVPLINADDVWQLDRNGNNCVQSGEECLTGKGITIGIIDTGVDYTHPDLGGCTTEQFLSGNCEKVVDGYDFFNTVDMNEDGDISDCYVEDLNGGYCEFEFERNKNRDNDLDDCYIELAGGNICEEERDPKDYGQHGTHVASTAAGNGDWDKDGVLEQGEGLNGVAPDAKIVAYQISTNGLFNFMDNIIGAVERGVDPNQDGDFSDHLDILSMSASAKCFDLGDYSEYCGPEDPMSNAFNNAVDMGLVVTISAGNSGSRGANTVGSPSAARNVITVGVSYKDDTFSGSTSQGPAIGHGFGIIKPDMVAPGEEICAALPLSWSGNCFDNNHVYKSGTSMSTPHVAGVVALIKQSHPDWKPREIKQVLRDTSVKLKREFPIFLQGYGRVDAVRAVLAEKPPISIIDTGGLVSEMVDIHGTALDQGNFDHFELKISKGILRTLVEQDYISEEELQSFILGKEWKEILDVALEGEKDFYPFFNQEWTTLSISNVPVTDNVLDFLDSQLFENDIYYLRLITYNKNGHFSEDRSIIMIQNQICGNSIIEYGEFCDSSYLLGQTCQSLGYEGGTLGCSSNNCQYDLSDCGKFMCVSGGEYNGDGTCKLQFKANWKGSGSIFKRSSDWDTARYSSIGSSRDNDLEIGSNYNNVEYSILRTFLVFDTSQIGNNLNIESLQLSVYPVYILNENLEDNYINIVQTTQASPTSLKLDDFDQCGLIDNPLLLSNLIPLNTLSINRENVINLNSLSPLNRNGFTLLGIREGHDLDNIVVSGHIELQLERIFSTPPKLIVNYKTSQCSSGADTIIADGIISQDELNNYIQQYYIGNANIDKLSNAIVEHLNGCV